MILDIKEIQDIQNLIDNQITESLTLEYKDGRKKVTDMVKDFSAFANTVGGTIIYGVSERNGIPVSFSWINKRGVKEQIENIVLSNVQPKIEYYKIKQFENPDNKEESVYVINILESVNVPHMSNDNKYYIRRDFKSEPMDDHEVKNAIFKKGLREALLEEINYNKDLARKTTSKVNQLYPYRPEDRQFLAFIPFRSEAWKSAVSSGLSSIIREHNIDLVNVYNLIYETNHLIELQKHGFGHNIVVTQTDDAKPNKGIYLPMLIRERAEKILGLLIKIQGNQK